MGLFDFMKKDKTSVDETVKKRFADSEAVESSGIKSEGFKLRGCDWYQDAFEPLKKVNPDFKLSAKEIIKKGLEGKTVYEYTFPKYDAELIPEPENEYDSNAVAVYVKGNKIGYIAKGNCSHVKNIVKGKEILDIVATLRGGKSKSVYEVDKGEYETETDKKKFGARIDIRYKE